MKSRYLVLVALITLTACAGNPTNLQGNAAAILPKTPTPEQVAEKMVVNENLPVVTLTFERRDGVKKQLMTEVAKTDLTRKIGLMNRTSLATDRAMLFVFESSGLMNFWMKNTLIPLDMVFVDQNRKIVHIVRGAQPCNTADCPLYNSKYSTKYVVELAAGVADSLGLAVGDAVSWL